MSVPEVKNVLIASPLVLTAFNSFNTGFNAVLEGPPIYTQIELTYEITGTSGSATYSYLNSKTFTRDLLNSSLSSVDSQFHTGAAYGYGTVPGIVSCDVGTPSTPGVGKFYCGQGLNLTWALLSDTMVDPAAQVPVFVMEGGSPITAPIEYGAVIGTQDNTPNPPTDIVADVFGYVPYAAYLVAPVEGERKSADAYQFVDDLVDITGWDQGQWRDWRGTYTYVDTSVPGVTETFTCVIS